MKLVATLSLVFLHALLKRVALVFSIYSIVVQQERIRDAREFVKNLSFDEVMDSVQSLVVSFL